MYDEFKDTCRHACLTTSKINLHKFCIALPSNLVFSRGFEIDRPMLSDKRYCYCPCSSKMREWQKKIKLDLHCSTKKKKFTLVGLLDHLCSYDDIYHRAVNIYSENLYAEVLEESKQGTKP